MENWTAATRSSLHSMSLRKFSFTSRALSNWEQKGYLQWLVTQNVDSLHTKAGSKNVTELHGCSHRVVCLNCPEVNVTKLLFKLHTHSVDLTSFPDMLKLHLLY